MQIRGEARHGHGIRAGTDDQEMMPTRDHVDEYPAALGSLQHRNATVGEQRAACLGNVGITKAHLDHPVLVHGERGAEFRSGEDGRDHRGTHP